MIWGSYGSNLLVNPGAEMGTTHGWHIHGMWGWPNSISRGNWAFAGFNGYMYQDVDVSEYSSQISAKALKVKGGAWGKKAGAPTNAQFRVRLQFIGNDGSEDYDSGWVIGVDWLVYRGCEKIVPEGTTAIRMRIEVRNGYEPRFCFLDDCNIQLAMAVIPTPPGPTYTKQTITCPQCGSELELTISSDPAENLPQNCPVCGNSIGEGTEIAIIKEEPWPPEEVPIGWFERIKEYWPLGIFIGGLIVSLGILVKKRKK